MQRLINMQGRRPVSWRMPSLNREGTTEPSVRRGAAAGISGGSASRAPARASVTHSLPALTGRADEHYFFFTVFDQQGSVWPAGREPGPYLRLVGAARRGRMREVERRRERGERGEDAALSGPC